MPSKIYDFLIVEDSIFLKWRICTLTFVFCLTCTLAMAQQNGNNSKGPSSLEKVNLKKQAKLAEAEAFVRSTIETCEAKVVQANAETNITGRTETLPSRATIKARYKVFYKNGTITFQEEANSHSSRPEFRSDTYLSTSIEVYARISDLAPTVGVLGAANAPWLVEGNMIAIECAVPGCWTHRLKVNELYLFDKVENKRKEMTGQSDTTSTERIFLLGVCPGMAERLQKALNDIIFLNGGKRGRY